MLAQMSPTFALLTMKLSSTIAKPSIPYVVRRQQVPGRQRQLVDVAQQRPPRPRMVSSDSPSAATWAPKSTRLVFG
jgi:hypothetical protein